jgi:hypothetical protein
VPRLLRLRRSYTRAVSRVAIVAGTPRAKRLATTINLLLDAESLPGPLDVEAMIPPTSHALVRRGAGENLWHDAPGAYWQSARLYPVSVAQPAPAASVPL